MRHCLALDGMHSMATRSLACKERFLFVFYCILNRSIEISRVQMTYLYICIIIGYHVHGLAGSILIGEVLQNLAVGSKNCSEQ